MGALAPRPEPAAAELVSHKVADFLDSTMKKTRRVRLLTAEIGREHNSVFLRQAFQLLHDMDDWNLEPNATWLHSMCLVTAQVFFLYLRGEDHRCDFHIHQLVGDGSGHLR